MEQRVGDQPLYDSEDRWDSLGRRGRLRGLCIDPDQPIVEEAEPVKAEEPTRLQAAE